MIRLRGVSHAFDGVPVLRDITLDLGEHRIGIIGANGSGKSTLARTFNGLVVPDSGSVTVDEVPVTAPGRRRRRGGSAPTRPAIGFMFADASAQIIMPTVEEDVALSLRGAGLTSAELRERVSAALARFGLTELRDRPAQLLSSGQKQMLAFAAVLVTEPRILVCDEPSTLLDLRNVELLRRTLDSVDQQVILLTHQLEMLDHYQRVLVIDDGAVVFDGPPAAAVAFYRQLMGASA